MQTCFPFDTPIETFPVSKQLHEPINSAARAFGDEIVLFADGNSFLTYGMACVLIDTRDESHVREELLRLHRNASTKLHWRTTTPTRRIQLAQTIARLNFVAVLVSMTPDFSIRPERQRRLCLLRLIDTIAASSCEHLTLESRGKSADAHDVSLAQTVRNLAGARTHPRVEHLAGTVEPLLWLPDIVCGAFGSKLRGNQRAWDMLATKVDHIALDSKGRPMD